MQEVFALTLASMRNDMARMDHVALNLANVSTPGYKRQVVATRPFIDALQDAQGLQLSEVLTDTRAGTVKSTGQPLDLALAGEGFFEVMTAKGPAYTRAGSFNVDARGRLVTSQGYPVMGKNGDIHLTGRSPTVDSAGNVSEAGATDGSQQATPIGQLKVVRFDKSEDLQRLGEGLFAAGEGMTLIPEADVQIRQGALENANVNTTREMVDLIQTMRHFETMHRVVQGYDEMIGAAVRKLTEA
jgi:flagellar basal-body rod protein FlgF